MRLYHWNYHRPIWCIFFGLITLIIASCANLPEQTELINVTIVVDNEEIHKTVEDGSTVQDALRSSQITLGQLDRVEPSLSSVISNGAILRVIRVREEYSTQREIIPFEHHDIENEALPEGESRLSQPGINGVKETTSLRIFEGEIIVSDSVVKSTTLSEPVDEVVMIGTKSVYDKNNFPGRIVYLSTGNAWMMDGSTSNRKLVVSTGDLDGRIFSLSMNRKFLLFTRLSKEKNEINTLWLAKVDEESPIVINLGVRNIVHFAEFDPSSQRVAYSTVEWSQTAPGWQANNDLYIMNISDNGEPSTPIRLIEPSSGGNYGWWGITFAWSPDGNNFLYILPDEIGLFNIESREITTLYRFTPYQTSGDWAWIPRTIWSPDGEIIYTFIRSVSNLNTSDQPEQFDLIAISLNNQSVIHLQNNTGIFSSISLSPIDNTKNINSSTPSETLNSDANSLVFTQSLFPEDIKSNNYQLVYMDRDGSNKRVIFPDEGMPGFEVQNVVWSPKTIDENQGSLVALIYHGNIWLINPMTGEHHQVTGDELTNRIDWR